MNILLDCGTHFGEGLDHLIQNYNIDNTWKIISFEANPNTYEKHKLSRKYNFVEYKYSAIHTEDGFIEFNIDPRDDNSGGGSSLIDLKYWNPQGLRETFKEKTTVPCIDFSKFIKNNFQESDNIFCKFDIEGAEYGVLEKMIQDDTLKYIKTLAIEFHSHFFESSSQMYYREAKIKEALNKNNIQLISWW